MDAGYVLSAEEPAPQHCQSRFACAMEKHKSPLICLT